MRTKSSHKSFSSLLGKRYYLCIISALLFFASLFPDYLLITNFIFLVPLLFFVENIKSGKDALKGGLLFGLFAYATLFHWFYSLLSISVFLCILLYSMIIIYFSLTSAVIVFLIYFIHSRWRIKFFLFLPFIWIILESLKAVGPFRLTIDHCANSMAIFPQLIQFIDTTGPYGIAFWLILVNALIFETMISYKKKRNWIKYAIAALLIAILPASYSLYKWKKLTYVPDLKVSIIQPDVPFEKKMKKEYEAENMNVMMSLTAEAIKETPDLIIWPETSYPRILVQWIDRDPEPSIPEVSEVARSSHIPILVGANYIRLRSKEDFDIYNAALLVDSNGDIKDYYGKVYLVPFTEALPFKDLLGIQRTRRKGLLAQLANFSSGTKFSIFEIENKSIEMSGNISANDQKNQEIKRKERFGILICYEGLFPELSRQFRKNGIDFLVCMTNDAWFGRTIAPYWHASALRLRAIENRVSIVRCANTGISCFFDPAGRMYQNSEIFTKGVITGSILAFPPSPPFYSRIGDLIVYAAYPALLILIILAIIFRKRNRKDNKK